MYSRRIREMDRAKGIKILGVVTVIVTIVMITKFVFSNIGWQTYNSPRGYILQFPKGWQVDQSREGEAYERIVAPKEEVMVAISVYKDDNPPSEKSFNDFIDEIRLSYRQNKAISLLSLDPKFHSGEYIIGEYVATSRWSKPTVVYEQTEVGMVTQGGHTYIVTVNVDSRSGKKYDGIVKEIFLRFKPILK